MQLLRTLLLANLLISMIHTVWADEPAPVDFARDVYPILQRACFECHGAIKQSGELRLHDRTSAFQGSSGPTIVPGQPDQSELLRRVKLPAGDDEIMPARGKPLPPQQIAVLERWISAGAVWPEDFQPPKHWAYVHLQRPNIPQVQDRQWPRNAIDAFVLQRLEAEKLKPASEAEALTLLRRLSLDLVGIPPSPQQAEAFLQAVQVNRMLAIEQLVDELLASPRFGEKWARPWLDLARYADSHGFQRDDLRELWPYRDWVIRALNDDMPFDRFTLEQIAGDLLPEANESTRIATGFHRCTTTNVEAGSEPEETRINQVMDRVNTTAAVWLGTTLECCQCHDHKYDPFTQRDYYQLLAYFNNTEIEADRSNPNVPGSIKFLGPMMTLAEQSIAPPAAVIEELAALQAQLNSRKAALLQDLPDWEKTLTPTTGQRPQEYVLTIAEFISTEGSAYRLLDDGSILLIEEAPETDTYIVKVQTQLKEITGFKLEALTDPSLPGKGPGRGDEKRPNFVLNTFSVTAAPLNKISASQNLKLNAVSASFSQKNFDAAGAVDDDPKTAWAINPRFHEPHWAIFATAEPTGFADGTTLTFTLTQKFGSARTIGRLRLSALTGALVTESLPTEIASLLAIPMEDRTSPQQQALLTYRLKQDELASNWLARIEELQPQAKPVPISTLVMQELATARETTIFQRGDYHSPGDPVHSGVPEVLRSSSNVSGNRIDLARWLCDRDNPLTARVVVNRWWAELFGRGLVSTVEDLGIQGEPPTHPELLDWLAVEFMDSGWSMKHVLRTMVLSATYQQSSRMTPELAARDDQNLLLARGPRFRLSAETIRDNALAIAGFLSEKSFGPPVRPYQPEGLWTKVGGAVVNYEVSPGEDQYRRGVYVVWKRASPYPSFINFDATGRLACTVKRSRSNTALQALTLLNDPVYVEAAQGLARRVLAECPHESLIERLRYAFHLCVTREPDEQELLILERLYQEQLEATQLARKPKNARQSQAGIDAATFAAWQAIATTLLNLDETITKN